MKKQETPLIYLLYQKFCNAVQNIKTGRHFNKLYLVMFVAIMVINTHFLMSIPKDIENETFRVFSTKLSLIESVICNIVIALMGVIVVGNPTKARAHSKAFQKVGITNSFGESPMLLHVVEAKNGTEYTYDNRGIPLSKMLELKDKIEAACNISIIDMYEGRNKQETVILARSGEEQLPKFIEWSERYTQESDSIIVLGKSIAGFKIIDLDSTPHIQCGGQTGCGKSVLLECALHQLYEKGVQIYLCDFKQFLDFPSSVRAKYNCVSTKEGLNRTLGELIDIMEYRKQLFASKDCAKISEYNNRFPEDRQERIILASDEIAYAFQKKGLKGEEKQLVEEIESKMELIAQQGRFAGIHLWLSTQRADAETIPPQIRSNCTVRIVGRSSEILSRVTVDNSLGAEIPMSIKGRFVDDTEEFFQAFYYEEK